MNHLPVTPGDSPPLNCHSGLFPLSRRPVISKTLLERGAHLDGLGLTSSASPTLCVCGKHCSPTTFPKPAAILTVHKERHQDG